jgi:hypothetical protein
MGFFVPFHDFIIVFFSVCLCVCVGALPSNIYFYSVLSWIKLFLPVPFKKLIFTMPMCNLYTRLVSVVFAVAQKGGFFDSDYWLNGKEKREKGGVEFCDYFSKLYKY